MRFLRPEMAAWLLVLPLAVIAWLARYQYRTRHALRVRGAVARFSRPSTRLREIAALSLAVLALGFLVAALMRPQLRREERTASFANRDLVIVLDRSVSMRARDVQPSRFERAIQEIQQFLQRKPEGIDRIGLVGLAGTSIILSYPTDDLGSLFFYLDYLRQDPTVYFGTDLSGALTSALSIARRERERTPPVFVVISDGDDQGAPVEHVATTLARGGIRVHAIGIGSDRSVPIPLPGNGPAEYLRDDSGQVLLTRFNESTLRQVAELTGGGYSRSVTGHEFRDALEHVVSAGRPQVGWDVSVTYTDLYLFMLAAAGIFALGVVTTL